MYSPFGVALKKSTKKATLKKVKTPDDAKSTSDSAKVAAKTVKKKTTSKAGTAAAGTAAVDESKPAAKTVKKKTTSKAGTAAAGTAAAGTAAVDEGKPAAKTVKKKTTSKAGTAAAGTAAAGTAAADEGKPAAKTVKKKTTSKAGTAAAGTAAADESKPAAKTVKKKTTSKAGTAAAGTAAVDESKPAAKTVKKKTTSKAGTAAAGTAAVDEGKPAAKTVKKKTTSKAGTAAAGTAAVDESKPAAKTVKKKTTSKAGTAAAGTAAADESKPAAKTVKKKTTSKAGTAAAGTAAAGTAAVDESKPAAKTVKKKTTSKAGTAAAGTAAADEGKPAAKTVKKKTTSTAGTAAAGTAAAGTAAAGTAAVDESKPAAKTVKKKTTSKAGTAAAGTAAVDEGKPAAKTVKKKTTSKAGTAAAGTAAAGTAAADEGKPAAKTVKKKTTSKAGTAAAGTAAADESKPAAKTVKKKTTSKAGTAAAGTAAVDESKPAAKTVKKKTTSKAGTAAAGTAAVDEGKPAAKTVKKKTTSKAGTAAAGTAAVDESKPAAKTVKKKTTSKAGTAAAGTAAVDEGKPAAKTVKKKTTSKAGTAAAGTAAADESKPAAKTVKKKTTSKAGTAAAGTAAVDESKPAAKTVKKKTTSKAGTAAAGTAAADESKPAAKTVKKKTTSKAGTAAAGTAAVDESKPAAKTVKKKSTSTNSLTASPLDSPTKAGSRLYALRGRLYSDGAASTVAPPESVAAPTADVDFRMRSATEILDTESVEDKLDSSLDSETVMQEDPGSATPERIMIVAATAGAESVATPELPLAAEPAPPEDCSDSVSSIPPLQDDASEEHYVAPAPAPESAAAPVPGSPISQAAVSAIDTFAGSRDGTKISTSADGSPLHRQALEAHLRRIYDKTGHDSRPGGKPTAAGIASSRSRLASRDEGQVHSSATLPAHSTRGPWNDIGVKHSAKLGVRLDTRRGTAFSSLPSLGFHAPGHRHLPPLSAGFHPKAHMLVGRLNAGTGLLGQSIPVRSDVFDTVGWGAGAGVVPPTGSGPSGSPARVSLPATSPPMLPQCVPPVESLSNSIKRRNWSVEPYKALLSVNASAIRSSATFEVQTGLNAHGVLPAPRNVLGQCGTAGWLAPVAVPSVVKATRSVGVSAQGILPAGARCSTAVVIRSVLPDPRAGARALLASCSSSIAASQAQHAPKPVEMRATGTQTGEDEAEAAQRKDRAETPEQRAAQQAKREQIKAKFRSAVRTVSFPVLRMRQALQDKAERDEMRPIGRVRAVVVKPGTSPRKQADFGKSLSRYGSRLFGEGTPLAGHAAESGIPGAAGATSSSRQRQSPSLEAAIAGLADQIVEDEEDATEEAGSWGGPGRRYLASETAAPESKTTEAVDAGPSSKGAYVGGTGRGRGGLSSTSQGSAYHDDNDHDSVDSADIEPPPEDSGGSRDALGRRGSVDLSMVPPPSPPGYTCCY